MNNKEVFFNELNSGTKWDAGVAFNRTNALPIDAKSVFPSLSALESYAASGAVAYPGQVVAVVVSGQSIPYILNDDGTVTQIVSVGDALDADSQTITNVAAPVNGTDATNKTYVDNAVTGVAAGIKWKGISDS